MARTRLERARRGAARRALYGSLVVVVVAVVALVPLLDRPLTEGPDQSWFDRDYPSLPEVRRLRAYASIDTSATTGSEIAGARWLADQLAAAGVDSRIEELGGGRANLWAVIEGELPRAVVLHHHIDVSPIRHPDAWDYPPFGAEIDLPWIYGRGVFDMKSVAIAHLEAFLAVHQRGVRPRNSLVLLATGGEESGSELGTRWVLTHHPELVERFWAVLTEGGVVEATGVSDVKYWGIEFAQKRFADAVACHPSRTRLEELAVDVIDQSQLHARLRVAPEVATFLASYGRTRDRGIFRELLADPRSLVRDRPAFHRLSRYLRALFRSELVPVGLEDDPGSSGSRLHLAFHLLPGAEPSGVRQRLLPPWITRGVEVTVDEPLGADGGSPVDHPVFRGLARAVEEEHPEAVAGPYFLAWSATDARFFRQAGVPAYGFSPFLILATDTLQVDQSNERIGLPGFVDGVAMFRRVAERLVDLR